MKRIIRTDSICLEDIAVEMTLQQAESACVNIANGLTDALRLFINSENVEIVFRNVPDRRFNPRGILGQFEISEPVK